MNNRGYMPVAKSVEWETPQALFDKLNKEFQFTLDPCSTHENTKCKKHYTKEEDGLKKSWSRERVFMNPPYGREISHWAKKARSETYGYFNDSDEACKFVVGLLPARTDVIWYHTFVYDTNKYQTLPGVEIRFLKGRLKFEVEGIPQDPATFSSMVVVWSSEP